MALSKIEDAEILSDVDLEVAGLQHEDTASRLAQWLLEQLEANRLTAAQYSAISTAMVTQAIACREEFDGQHDYVRWLGQDNFRRFRPVWGLTILVGGEDSTGDVLIAVAAALLVGTDPPSRWNRKRLRR